MINLLYANETSCYKLVGIENLDLETLYLMMFDTQHTYNTTYQWFYELFTTDIDTILLRQSVLKDLYLNPDLARDLDSFYVCVERWREYAKKSVSTNDENGFVNSMADFAYAIESLEVFRSFYQTFNTAVVNKSITSPGLKMLAEYIIEVYNSQQLESVYQRFIKIYEDTYDQMSLEIGFDFDDTFHITGRKLFSVKKDHENVGRKVPLVGSSSQKKLERDLSNLNEAVRDTMRVCIADSQKSVATFLRKLSVPFKNTLAYYLGGLNLIKKLTINGCTYCFPTVSNDSSFQATGLYTSLLLHYGKTANEIVTNDITFKNRQLCVLTGANQGGKTTFLKSIGLAQFMFQLGLPVCAESAEMGVCDNMVTIFSDIKYEHNNTGTMEQELQMISESLRQINSNNLFVLLNEPLTSTGQKDSYLIMQSILNIISGFGGRGIIVTHLHKLASEVEKDPERFKNLVTLSNDNDNLTLTYKISEGKPINTSYAYNVVTRKGIIF